MWKCPHCGATTNVRAFCEGCARPIEPAVTEIGQKVRRLRVKNDLYAKWFWRGAKAGFLVGVILCGVFAVLTLRHSLVSGPERVSLLQAILWTVYFFLSVSVFALPLVFGSAAVGVGLAITGIKPVLIALFCSVERFEQEYGSSETKGQRERE